MSFTECKRESKEQKTADSYFVKTEENNKAIDFIEVSVVREDNLKENSLNKKEKALNIKADALKNISKQAIKNARLVLLKAISGSKVLIKRLAPIVIKAVRASKQKLMPALRLMAKGAEKKLAPITSKASTLIKKELEKNGGNIPPKAFSYFRRAVIGVLGVTAMVGIVCGFITKNAQAVYVNNVQVGIIEDTEITGDVLYNEAIEALKNKKGVEVEVNEAVTLTPIHASSDEVSSQQDIVNAISDSFTYQVEAASISVNGEELFYFESKEKAEALLDKIANLYISKDAKVIEKSFVEDVEIKSLFINSAKLSDEKEAYDFLTKNVNADKVYTIVEGDTLWDIASKNDMSIEALLKANPEVTEDSILALGQELNLCVKKPYLSVKVVEQAVYKAVAPKKTETVENNSEYKTYRKVLIEGKDGEKEVTANIVKVNGIEESREILNEVILVEPINAKVEVGTMKVPPKKAIGSFKYPVLGRLSSRFGARWGTTHKGIDLAAPAGTPVYASDGGTVTFAGWGNGYGYLVKINHGNGYVTYYGHNSRLAVSVGQKVAQGELIAYVGSTGNSTGNHVHFEIRKNGVPINPLNLL